jgi:hydroxyacylglutathione hydrolase
MFLASFPAGPWQANCYVFGFAEGRVVVVDPGVDALAPVQRLVAEHELSVEAVLLTHGHIDHVAQAADVADHFGVPAHLHVLDRPLLSDPTSGRPQMRQMVAQLGVEVREPADLRLLEGGETLTAAGATFTVVHAPGHRPGCVLFRVPLAEPVEEAPELTELIFTGQAAVRLPRVPARRAHRRAGRPRHAARDLRAARLRAGRDPRRRDDGLSSPARARSPRRSTSSGGCTPTPRRRRTNWACTST